MATGLATRVRRALLRRLRALGRHAAFHRPALSLVRAWNRGTFRRLGGDPAVAAVYARGSLVRGPFYPLASDVDLVIVARATALASAAGARALIATVHRERRRNPSVRDWWQHLLHEMELPVVRANWELFATDEWRDARGETPWAAAPAADRDRLVAAHWAQQRAWSASAVQPLVQPGAPFHVFDTGVRKCAFLAGRLRRIAAWSGPPLVPAELFALRRDHALEFDAAFLPPPETAEARLAALATTLRELEVGARTVRRHLPRAAAGVAPATAGEARWPGELAALPAHCPAIVIGERTLHILVEDNAGAAELAALLVALRDLPALARPLTFLVPHAAADLWPLPCEASPPVVFARDARLAERLAAAADDVELQRELRRYEALFLPCAARLALGFDDAAARLRRAASGLAAAVLLFTDGRIAGSRAEAVAAAAPPASALADLAGELRACLAEGDGDSPRTDGDRLYALCEALGTRLFAALARPAAAPAAPVAAETHA